MPLSSLIVGTLLLGGQQGKPPAIPDWVFQLDVREDMNPVDRRTSVESPFREGPRQFSFATLFPQIPLFARFTAALGELVPSAFIKEAKRGAGIKGGTIQFMIWGASTTNGFTYTVDSRNRITDASQLFYIPFTATEDVLKIQRSRIVKKLGQPNSATRNDERRDYSMIWSWSDGSNLYVSADFDSKLKGNDLIYIAMSAE